ncbi:sporulation protein [Paenibacillus sp. FSL R5-0490]|uniref:CAP domain-containing protein n=1 Tax=Bacillales TaxID=1385 RepID=UPI00096CD537|nr:CAP domain-containing protein [Paenibacillus sp. FSL R5-0490]OMF56093.1 sporulation protein [Paenibacillus sp. FSL R5-0490]
MNKKVIYSVAAAAALLVSAPGANQADAASNCPTPEQAKKIAISQSGNLSQEQINNILQKHLKDYNINWGNAQVNKQEAQKPAAPAAPAPAEQPAKAPAKTQEAAKAPAQQQAPAEQTKEAAPASSAVSAYEKKVLELTNQERAKAGVPALKLDEELSKVAREKSRDMQSKGYFDHNSPTYGSPFDMMKQFGISYTTAGENIAMGQQSPEEVVQAWMNSEGHRKNIMNANFTHLGVGHVADGNYWTQMFIGK